MTGRWLPAKPSGRGRALGSDRRVVRTILFVLAATVVALGFFAERSRTKHFYRDMLAHLYYFVFINPLFHPARISHDRSEPSGEVWFCSAKIGPAEFQQLKDKSNSVGGTVDDILMAVCYRSIDKWNQRHGKRTKKISLLIPIDIGTPDLNGIISNQISYISFSTCARERTDSTGLLRKVRAERIRKLIGIMTNCWSSASVLNGAAKAA